MKMTEQASPAQESIFKCEGGGRYTCGINIYTSGLFTYFL